MSDEVHMESAWRHRDMTAGAQWHGPQPDEAMMAAEEGEAVVYRTPGEWYWLLEALLVYLFANNNARQWQGVAVRAAFVIRRCAIWMLKDERTTAELDRLKSEVTCWDTFGINDFLVLCSDEDFREALARVLEFFYPARNNRLFLGTKRVYLVARGFCPGLVKVDGKELTYEQMAAIFEGDALATPQARNRARSRWSARVQEVLRKPIEASGGTARLQFSKSATAREKMAGSARGNLNRRGTGKKRGEGNVTVDSTP